MRIELRSDTVAIWAPAKVNLFLEILAKRADGYHALETLMVAVSLFDELEFREERSGIIQLQCDHPELSTGPDNLICRAAALLQKRTGCTHGAGILLRKRIPMAAGLAGGSSDAAAALAGLNQLWKLALSSSELAELGSELGSDVAFFFSTPAAWCTGRGEQVMPLTLPKTLEFVLVCPREGLSTAAVFRAVRVPEAPIPGTPLLEALEAGDVEAIGRGLHNRLQETAEHLCPTVAEVRRQLEQQGPAGHRMSGSGTSSFALCRDSSEAQRIALALSQGWKEEARPRVIRVTSCS